MLINHFKIATKNITFFKELLNRSYLIPIINIDNLINNISKLDTLFQSYLRKLGIYST
jgi:hypothetical protein